MGAGQWFWIVFVIIGILGGGVGFWQPIDRRWIGAGFVIYLLLGLLGWGVFGPPIK